MSLNVSIWSNAEDPSIFFDLRYPQPDVLFFQFSSLDWLSIPEETAYEKLMVDVENFINNPGEKDVQVSEVFTQSMFEKLDKRLTDVNWKSMRTYWENDFSKRKIVDGFLKDDTLGSKRLASMPDRYTNLINTN